MFGYNGEHSNKRIIKGVPGGGGRLSIKLRLEDRGGYARTGASPFGGDGVILAGGRSRRMGREKSAIPLGSGETLLTRQLRRFRAVVEGTVWVARPWDWRQPAEWEIVDDVADGGPLEGIRGALKKTRHPYLAVLAVDLPEASAKELWRQLAAALPPPSAAAVIARGQPLVGFWPRAWEAELTQFLTSGLRRVGDFLQPRAVIALDVKPAWLTNLNSPDDLRAWEIDRG